ncbi:BTB/POZ and MATH domain-containing protein 3-like [Miscanthus floridulus]|uniref:BTB/POZ and MATH domain-containing protein 3-like n=1 Tax=Miscanthus floridulus TaxID=154761 RepID=UPI0034585931
MEQLLLPCRKPIVTHGGKNGSCIESPAINAGGHAWRLHLYLNGAKEEDAGFVSLHLCLSDAAAAAAGTIVHADFELALVHHQGTLVRWPSSYGVSAIRPFSPETPWGCQRFISLEHLERSMFLKDDCFAVRCKVTVVEDRPCVKEGVVDAQDVQWLGLLCMCNDATCKRHHADACADPLGAVC